MPPRPIEVRAGQGGSGGRSYLDDDASEDMSSSVLLDSPPELPEEEQQPPSPSDSPRRRPDQAAMPVVSERLVLVVFRAPRPNYRQQLRQLIREGIIARNECYSPQNLHRWTVNMAIKVRSKASLSSAMQTATQGLNLHSRGPVAFCLDGFFHGAAEFGNIFGEEAAPRRLVKPGATPASLGLQDGGSIFMSVRHTN